MAKRINDKVAKSADQLLAFMQEITRSSMHLGYQEYASAVAVLIKRFPGDRSILRLRTMLDSAEMVEASRSYDSLENQIKTLERRLATEPLSVAARLRLVKKIEVYKTFMKEFEEAIKKHEFNLSRTLEVIAMDIMIRAISKCPIRKDIHGNSSGVLANSADYSVTSTGFTVGFYVPYAWFAHENIAGKVKAKHPVHYIKYFGRVIGSYHCGGDGKFLELAVQEVFPDKKIVCENEDGAVTWTYDISWGWI